VYFHALLVDTGSVGATTYLFSVREKALAGVHGNDPLRTVPPLSETRNL
jgi:hypothetical protein